MPRLLIVTTLALAAGQAPGVGEPYTPHESQIAHHGAQIGKHFGTKLSEMGGAMLGGAKKMITALSAAAVPVGPLPDPSHMLKEHQQMVEWWCAQPNHSDTYACRKKVHLEKLKKTPPNSTARQALLKQSPTRACMSSAAADKECQAQNLKEVQTMMRQYCSRFDGASQARTRPAQPTSPVVHRHPLLVGSLRRRRRCAGRAVSTTCCSDRRCGR